MRGNDLAAVLSSREPVDHARLIMPIHQRGGRGLWYDMINIRHRAPALWGMAEADVTCGQPVPPPVYENPEVPDGERMRHSTQHVCGRLRRTIVYDDRRQLTAQK